MTEYGLIALDVSPNMNADDLAHRARIALENPVAELLLFSSAWDNDPRDLWEIPEAIASWVSMGALADAYGFRSRLNAQGARVLELCEAVEDGKRVERVNDHRVEIREPYMQDGHRRSE